MARPNLITRLLISLALASFLSACGDAHNDLLSKGKPFPIGRGQLPITPNDLLKKTFRSSEDIFADLQNLSYASRTDSEGRALLASVDKLVEQNIDFKWSPDNELLLANADKLQDRRLYYKGVPVFGAQIKQVFNENETNWASGFIPAWSRVIENSENISVTLFSLSEEQVKNLVASELNFHPWRLVRFEKFYLATFKGLRAAYRFTVLSSGSLPGRGPSSSLQVFADAETGEVISQTPTTFHLDGTARAYRENSVVSASEGIVNVTLPNLINGTRLESSEFFEVRNCHLRPASNQCELFASSTNGDFSDIDFDSQSYDEVVAYYTIGKAMAWNKKMLGSASLLHKTAASGWGENRHNLGLSSNYKLRVFVRSKMLVDGNYTLANGQYDADGFDASNQPAIYIGTGWEDKGEPSEIASSFQYLGRDSDVVLHEFGHHMMFRSVQANGKESVALHEGFSDYFAYAITGNNKLAESVKSFGPLRAGDKAGVLSDYKKLVAHQVGEYWSSILWKLRATLGVGKDGAYRMDRIAWDSVDFLKQKTTYYEAIGALAKAAEIYAATNQENAVELKEKIFHEFHAREFIALPAGKGILPASVEDKFPLDGGKNQTSNSGSVCGVVASMSETQRSSVYWLFLAGLCCPLLVRRNKQRQ